MFLQGFFPALGLFFLHKIICLVIKNPTYKIICSTFTIIFALSSLLFYYNLGTSLIDLQISFLPLAALYLLLKLKDKYYNKVLFITGILCGVAVGLKLTMSMYALAFFTIVLLDIIISKKKLYLLFIFIFGSLTGYLVINGYWAYTLIKKYHNPMFPLYNNIFHSPLTDTISYQVKNLHPTSLIQWLAYPFFWYSNDTISAHVIFMPYNNISWAFVYTITIAYLLAQINNRTKNFLYLKLNNVIDVRKLNILIYYISISYFTWIIFFSVLRYAIIIDLFIGFFISIFILFIFSGLNKKLIYTVLFVIICCQICHATTYPHDKKRYPDYTLFEAENVNFPDNSVIFSAGFPVGFAAVYQNPNVHYVYSFNDPNMEFQYTEKSKEIVNKYIKNSNGNIYALLGAYGYDGKYDSRYIWDEKYIIDTNSCKIISNNFIVNDEFVGYCVVLKSHTKV